MYKKICILLAIILFSMIPSVVYAGQWQQDSTGWRYLTDDGTCAVGWFQDIDGKWYYLDTETTYMLADTTTPDGYIVASNGEWIEEGTVGMDKKGYDNKVDLQATAYENPVGSHDIGYTVPVTIYYNNEYELKYDATISIKNVEVSKSGVPYIEFIVDSDMRAESLNTKCIHHLNDDSIVEIKGSVTGDSSKNNSYPLLTRIKSKDLKTVSVEIYVGTE